MNTVRQAAIITLIGFILLGPGLVQILGLDFPQIRSWRMYSSVGIGAPYGTFEVLVSGEPVRVIMLVDAMGVDSIRRIQAYDGSGSLRDGFDADAAIRGAGAKICETLSPGEALRYSGRLAVHGRWQDLAFTHDDLCGVQ